MQTSTETKNDYVSLTMTCNKLQRSSVGDRRYCQLIAKFHYTGPSGPERTRPDEVRGLCRRPGWPGFWQSPRTSSGRVRSDPVGTVQWNLAISRPTTVQFFTLGASTFVELSRWHASTIDMPKQVVSKSGVWDKVPEGSTLIFEDTRISFNTV